MWLSLRVGTPPDETVQTAAALLTQVGAGAKEGSLVGGGALYLAMTRRRDHPRGEEMHKLAVGMLSACAAARNIAPDQFKQWIESEGLTDPARLLPALDIALRGIIGKDGWLFDPADLTLLRSPGA